MNITFIVPGSRGDIHNVIPLALELIERKHNVTVVTHKNFDYLFKRHKIPFCPVSVDSEKLAQSEDFLRFMKANAIGRLHGYFNFQHSFRESISIMTREIFSLCADSDILVCNHLGIFFGAHISEKRNIPYVFISSVAVGVTKAYPSSYAGGEFKGHRLINRTTHRLEQIFFAWMCRKALNQFRMQTIGLPRMSLGFNYLRSNGKHIPVLMSVSPAVLPPLTDLDPNVHVLGSWINNVTKLKNAQKLSKECREFIEDGAPPVYIGFGSMNSAFGIDLLLELAREIIAVTGRRVLLLSGWNKKKIATKEKDLLITIEEPHELLFPKMEMIIHHGGASTLTNTLIAGRPSIVVPVIIDQFFWGMRAREIGVAPAMLPLKKLTAKKLAGAVTKVLADPSYAANAQKIQQKITQEKGEQAAADIIENL